MPRLQGEYKSIYKSLDILKSSIECRICQENLNQPASTSCGHIFCKKCIQKAISVAVQVTGALKNSNKSSCPLCNTPVSRRCIIVQPNITSIFNRLEEVVSAFEEEFSESIGTTVAEIHASPPNCGHEAPPTPVISYSPSAKASAMFSASKDRLRLADSNITIEVSTRSRRSILNPRKFKESGFYQLIPPQKEVSVETPENAQILNNEDLPSSESKDAVLPTKPTNPQEKVYEWLEEVKTDAIPTQDHPHSEPLSDEQALISVSQNFPRYIRVKQKTLGSPSKNNLDKSLDKTTCVSFSKETSRSPINKTKDPFEFNSIESTNSNEVLATRKHTIPVKTYSKTKKGIRLEDLEDSKEETLENSSQKLDVREGIFSSQPDAQVKLWEKKLQNLDIEESFRINRNSKKILIPPCSRTLRKTPERTLLAIQKIKQKQEEAENYELTIESKNLSKRNNRTRESVKKSLNWSSNESPSTLDTNAISVVTSLQALPLEPENTKQKEENTRKLNFSSPGWSRLKQLKTDLISPEIGIKVPLSMTITNPPLHTQKLVTNEIDVVIATSDSIETCLSTQDPEIVEVNLPRKISEDIVSNDAPKKRTLNLVNLSQNSDETITVASKESFPKEIDDDITSNDSSKNKIQISVNLSKKNVEHLVHSKNTDPLKLSLDLADPSNLVEHVPETVKVILNTEEEDEVYDETARKVEGANIQFSQLESCVSREQSQTCIENSEPTKIIYTTEMSPLTSNEIETNTQSQPFSCNTQISSSSVHLLEKIHNVRGESSKRKTFSLESNTEDIMHPHHQSTQKQLKSLSSASDNDAKEEINKIHHRSRDDPPHKSQSPPPPNAAKIRPPPRVIFKRRGTLEKVHLGEPYKTPFLKLGFLSPKLKDMGITMRVVKRPILTKATPAKKLCICTGIQTSPKVSNISKASQSSPPNRTIDTGVQITPSLLNLQSKEIQTNSPNIDLKNGTLTSGIQKIPNGSAVIKYLPSSTSLEQRNDCLSMDVSIISDSEENRETNKIYSSCTLPVLSVHELNPLALKDQNIKSSQESEEIILASVSQPIALHAIHKSLLNKDLGDSLSNSSAKASDVSLKTPEMSAAESDYSDGLSKSQEKHIKLSRKRRRVALNSSWSEEDEENEQLPISHPPKRMNRLSIKKKLLPTKQEDIIMSSPNNTLVRAVVDRDLNLAKEVSSKIEEDPFTDFFSPDSNETINIETTPNEATSPDVLDSMLDSKESMLPFKKKNSNNEKDFNSSPIQKKIIDSQTPVTAKLFENPMETETKNSCEETDASEDEIVEGTPKRELSTELHMEEPEMLSSSHFSHSENHVGSCQLATLIEQPLGSLSSQCLQPKMLQSSENARLLCTNDILSVDTPPVLAPLVKLPTYLPLAEKNQNQKLETLKSNSAKLSQQKNIESLTLQNIPVQRKISLVASGLHMEKVLHILKQFQTKFSAELRPNFLPRTTHVVVNPEPNNKTPTTVKVLKGLASGSWIVSFLWIQACLVADKIVDEEPYEMLTGNGDKGPKTSRLAKRRLFEEFEFICLPPMPVFNITEFEELVTLAGAKCIQENEMNSTPCTKKYRFMILSDDYNLDDLKDCPWPAVNMDWILSCLEKYELISLEPSLMRSVDHILLVNMGIPQELLKEDTPSTFTNSLMDYS